jgi:hypothetical protein
MRTHWHTRRLYHTHSLGYMRGFFGQYQGVLCSCAMAGSGYSAVHMISDL